MDGHSFNLFPFCVLVCLTIYSISATKIPDLKEKEVMVQTPFKGLDEIPVPKKRLEIANNRKDKTSQNKPNITSLPPANTAAIGASTALYRLNSEGGGTCILFRCDALVGFNFITKLNEVQERDSFVPTNAQVKGDCSDEDNQSMVLKWKSFVLILFFSKTPGGERWYLAKMDLKFDSSDHFFEHIKNPGRSYTLSTSADGQLLFPTPVGKSYVCEREIEVKLSSPETDTTATVFLRDLKLEPFIFKNDEFGPEYKCSASGAGSYRSETAPLVVGSMLASACLITVVGYAIYRYFNVEKVQYDTME